MNRPIIAALCFLAAAGLALLYYQHHIAPGANAAKPASTAIVIEPLAHPPLAEPAAAAPATTPAKAAPPARAEAAPAKSARATTDAEGARDEIGDAAKRSTAEAIAQQQAIREAETELRRQIADAGIKARTVDDPSLVDGASSLTRTFRASSLSVLEVSPFAPVIEVGSADHVVVVAEAPAPILRTLRFAMRGTTLHMTRDSGEREEIHVKSVNGKTTVRLNGVVVGSVEPRLRIEVPRGTPLVIDNNFGATVGDTGGPVDIRVGGMDATLGKVGAVKASLDNDGSLRVREASGHEHSFDVNAHGSVRVASIVGDKVTVFSNAVGDATFGSVDIHDAVLKTHGDGDVLVRSGAITRLHAVADSVGDVTVRGGVAEADVAVANMGGVHLPRDTKVTKQQKGGYGEITFH